MNGPTWFLIGTAAGIAGTCLVMLGIALRNALRAAFQDLGARIDAVLDEPDTDEPEPHIEDDVWDRDLRNLITDSID